MCGFLCVFSQCNLVLDCLEETVKELINICLGQRTKIRFIPEIRCPILSAAQITQQSYLIWHTLVVVVPRIRWVCRIKCKTTYICLNSIHGVNNLSQMVEEGSDKAKRRPVRQSAAGPWSVFLHFVDF